MFVGSNVYIYYKNWKGNLSWRNVKPKTIRFASTPFHKEEQWLLEAYDLDKNCERTFAIKDILVWTTNIPEGANGYNH